MSTGVDLEERVRRLEKFLSSLHLSSMKMKILLGFLMMGVREVLFDSVI